MSKLIRVDTQTYEKITNIQSVFGATKQDVVQRAIERLSKDLLLAQTDVAFKKLKRDKKAWKQELAERQEWDMLNDVVDHE
jgi:hypothetical protein